MIRRQQLRGWIRTTGAGVVVGTLVFGPPTWAALKIVSSGSLVSTTTTTVTVTSYSGALIEVIPVLALWLAVLVVGALQAAKFRVRPL